MGLMQTERAVPSKRRSIVLAVLIFVFVFLLVARLATVLLDALAQRSLAQRSWERAFLDAAVATMIIAVIAAWITSRGAYLALRSGRIPYPLGPWLIRSFSRSVRFAHWRVWSMISLGVLVLLLFGWIRSYWRADSITFPATKTSSIRVSSCVGIVMVEYLAFPTEQHFEVSSHEAARFMEGYEIWTLSLASAMGKNSVSGSDYGFYAFRTKNWSFTANGRRCVLMSLNLPDWLFAVLFAILPGQTLVAGFLRARRAQGHLCQSCGYDLTGNTSGACPECGERI